MNLIEKLKANKVLPIIRSCEPVDVLNKIKALLAGGLDVIEVNVENPQIFNVIKEMSKEAIICAGGIITSIQAQTAIDSGAKIFPLQFFKLTLLKYQKTSTYLLLQEHQQLMKLIVLGNQEFLS